MTKLITTWFMAAVIRPHVERAATVIVANCDRASRRFAVGRRAGLGDAVCRENECMAALAVKRPQSSELLQFSVRTRMEAARLVIAEGI